MGQLPGRQRDAARDAGRRATLSRRAMRPISPTSRRRHCRSMTPRKSSTCLKQRFPAIVGPHKEDICYATTNRQEAVKRVAPHRRCDDRGRRAEFVELAAPQGSRRARGLSARGAGAARRRYRLERVRRHRAASASPRAHRRRKCWSRKSSTPSPQRYTVECRDRLRRRGGGVLSAAASAARKPGGGVGCMAVYTDVSADDLARFSPATTSANCSPTRASPKASRIRIFSCTPRTGNFILTLYEKRVAGGRPAVLPRPDGASRRARAHLSAAGEEQEGRHARRGRRAAGGDRHVSRWPVDSPAERRALRRGRRSAGAAASRRQRFQDASGRMRCRSKAGGRCSSMPGARGDSVRPACATRSSSELDVPGEELAARSAARASFMPICFPTTCSFSATELSGLIDFYFACNDMFAYDVAICLNCLVLRAGSFLQRHQGPRAAAGLRAGAAAVGRRARGAAGAGARRGDAFPADAAGRLAGGAGRRAGASRRTRWNISASCASTSR